MASVDVRVGDCRDLMRQMPERSARCCVTSPPYFGLRDYGVDGQLGLEATPDEFVAAMVEVFREVRRVLEAAAPTPRALFALCYGAGMEVSAALRTLRRDVDTERWDIFARGTKNAWRTRQVVLAEWARPIVASYVREMLPDTPLFPGVTRWTASDQHRAALEAVGLRAEGAGEGYTLHDARHHWAVRAIRAGTPIELVARQLGHANGVLALKVYGRFVPTGEERRRWEAAATAEDRRRGTLGGTATNREATRGP